MPRRGKKTVRPAETYRGNRRNLVRAEIKAYRKQGTPMTFRDVFADAQKTWARHGGKAPKPWYVGFESRGKDWDRSKIGKREVGRHAPSAS